MGQEGLDKYKKKISHSWNMVGPRANAESLPPESMCLNPSLHCHYQHGDLQSVLIK